MDADLQRPSHIIGEGRVGADLQRKSEIAADCHNTMLGSGLRLGTRLRSPTLPYDS
jgi:hypothetical protein